jgi:hypothetical protein
MILRIAYSGRDLKGGGLRGAKEGEGKERGRDPRRADSLALGRRGGEKRVRGKRSGKS